MTGSKHNLEGNGSRIYAGLKPDTTVGDLRNSLPPGQTRTTSWALSRSRATAYSFLPERFALWAVMLLSLRFSRTAM